MDDSAKSHVTASSGSRSTLTDDHDTCGAYLKLDTQDKATLSPAHHPASKTCGDELFAVLSDVTFDDDGIEANGTLPCSNHINHTTASKIHVFEVLESQAHRLAQRRAFKLKHRPPIPVMMIARKSWSHASRHKHAQSRVRNSSGRFEPSRSSQ
mmetsp:Transcript_26542/g.71707  ORF Transcript_26542/g.71707 Transcript_26542/m.71707 type:complete len:154 (+) Transcript_26542:56-517(+)